MTPTVERLNIEDTNRAFNWCLIYIGLGVFVWVMTGWWVFLLFNLFICYLELKMAKSKRLFRLHLEQKMILQIREHGYNEVRMSILRFEEEADDDETRYEQYKRLQFAHLLRSIMEEVKEEIDSHESEANA